MSRLKRTKKQDWSYLKTSKPITEWRRIHRENSKRHRMMLDLKQRAAELMLAIHSTYLLSPTGAKEALMDRIRRALDLGRGWSLEEYDHSNKVLSEVENKVRQYRRRRIRGNHDLTNAILMLIRLAKATDEEKMLSLAEVLEYQTAVMTPKQVAEQPQNLANYLVNLLREPDGYYPSWLPEMLGAHIKSTLNQEDINRLINDLQETNKDWAFFDMLFRFNDEMEAKEKVEREQIAMDLG